MATRATAAATATTTSTTTRTAARAAAAASTLDLLADTGTRSLLAGAVVLRTLEGLRAAALLLEARATHCLFDLADYRRGVAASSIISPSSIILVSGARGHRGGGLFGRTFGLAFGRSLGLGVLVLRGGRGLSSGRCVG